jgi:DeoR/GlpR family transcriptional regulator of sugar metabolism
MEKPETKLNSQERIFEIIIRLKKNHFLGLTNKELASLVGTSEANICRDLGIFQTYQWIERSMAGKWRLSPDFGKLAGEIMKSYKDAKLLLSKDEERFASAMQ